MRIAVLCFVLAIGILGGQDMKQAPYPTWVIPTVVALVICGLVTGHRSLNRRKREAIEPMSFDWRYRNGGSKY